MKNKATNFYCYKTQNWQCAINILQYISALKCATIETGAPLLRKSSGLILVIAINYLTTLCNAEKEMLRTKR
jgi:hypothetical protein